METKEKKECIICRRILLDEKVPICHNCRSKINDGALLGGSIFLSVAKILPKGIKKVKDIL